MRWLSTLPLLVVVACDPWSAPGVYQAHSSGYDAVNGAPCGTYGAEVAYCRPSSECLAEDQHRCFTEWDHCARPYDTWEPRPDEPGGIPCGPGVCLNGNICDGGMCVEKICPPED